jgi:hypothetical protein
MKYLIYANEQDAQDRSEEIAINQGCNSDITKYWFGWITSYTNPPATALMVPDDQTDLLDPSEQSLLQTEAQLEAMGWFPPQSSPIP